MLISSRWRRWLSSCANTAGTKAVAKSMAPAKTSTAFLIIVEASSCEPLFSFFRAKTHGDSRLRGGGALDKRWFFEFWKGGGDSWPPRRPGGKIHDGKAKARQRV